VVHPYYVEVRGSSAVHQPEFLCIQPGDVVWVEPPAAPAYLASVLYVEGGARSAHPSYAQVVREDDLAVLTIQPDWVSQRCAG